MRPVVCLECQQPACLARDAQEFEHVVLIHLVEESHGPKMGGAAGCRASLCPALPEAEGQAGPVRAGRTLEVVDETGRASGLLVSHLVVGVQALLVCARSADRAERHEIPLTVAKVTTGVLPVERVRDREAGIGLRDGTKVRQRVHWIRTLRVCRRLSNAEIELFRITGVIGRKSCFWPERTDDRARGPRQQPGDARSPGEPTPALGPRDADRGHDPILPEYGNGNGH